MRVAVYPGSFDPITNGHLDIIKRSVKVFDEVIVTVLINPEKKGLFTPEERVELIKKVVKDIPNVRVESFFGLLVDFMREKNSNIIIKGLRAVSDFEYEFQMALINNTLDANVETLFMMTSAQNLFLSSSSVKQVAMFNGDITGLVPEVVAEELNAKITETRKNKGD